MFQMKHLNKKGVFGQLAALGVGVATLVIILAVTFLIIAETGDQTATQGGATNYTACVTTACNATKTLQAGAATIPDWIPLVILVAIGGLILSLVAVFGRRR